jgi:hypothetical protein
MTTEDIIRSFLNLHPDTRFDMTEYAIPLLMIRQMAEALRTAEREACLTACRIYLKDEEPYPGFQNGVACCIGAIKNHEEFLAHMKKKGQK